MLTRPRTGVSASITISLLARLSNSEPNVVYVVRKDPRIFSLKVLRITLHEQTNDKTKQSKNSSEDLNGEDLDEPRNVSILWPNCECSDGDSQCRVGGVCQSRATPVDAYTDTANQVAHSNSQASPEQRVSGENVGRRVDLFDVVELGELGGEDDGHDDAVNGDDFAENDGDQILGSYPRRLNTSSENGNTCRPDSPAFASDVSCVS